MGHDDLRFSVGFMMFVVFAATFVPACAPHGSIPLLH